MQKLDIRPLKNKLREQIKTRRQTWDRDEKQAADGAILARVGALREYARCRVVLSFVSTPIEVDTRALIQRAWQDGKQVAVPRCVPGSREMCFYFIRSFEELKPGTFGVLEPEPDEKKLLRHMAGSICVVPALACDRRGYRLGYGGGYYDRFLSHYHQPKICVLYDYDLQHQLWHGRYDVPVDLIVTDKRLISCKSTRTSKRGHALYSHGKRHM